MGVYPSDLHVLPRVSLHLPPVSHPGRRATHPRKAHFPMPYVYRCRQCRAASPPAPRSAAETHRQQHRDTEHGGLAPDGEEIIRVPSSARDPDSRYVSTEAVLGGLALLVLASAIARALGR